MTVRLAAGRTFHTLRAAMFLAVALGLATGLSGATELESRARRVVAQGGTESNHIIDAAPDQAVPVVFDGHPRLIVGGYRGVSVPELKAACAHDDMRGECDRIGGRHMLDDAMKHVLFDDAAAAGRVRTKLLDGLSCSDGYEHSAAGGYALAYDWVWDTLSPEERTRVETTLADCGASITRSLRGNGPHLWHGFTSQASALALVALSIDDHPSRAALLANAAELFRARSLEAYEVTGGAWPEGYSYMRTHFFSSDPPYQYVIDALRAWDSAVKQDHPAHASLFATVAEEEGDWLRGLAYHVLYGTVDSYTSVPELTLLRGGDMPTGQAYPNKQYRPFMDAIARIYNDTPLKRFGIELENDWSFVGGAGTYHPIHRYSLPYNLPVHVRSGESLRGLPVSRIWSRDDLGYVLIRAFPWLEGHAQVTYRAGKWFTGHQHMDQGHFDIWRHGPLAVDSGVYARWGSEHREGYYSRAVAHNTVLIHQPGETFEQHPGYGEHVNDDGQRIHTHNKRGCAQCMQSVEEWRSNIDEGMHFESGRIEALDLEGWAHSIRSDITGAYNSINHSTPGNTPKVSLVQRDLTYLGVNSVETVLIVADRVRTMPGAGPPRFTLHVPTRPEVDGMRVISGSSDDGILESSTDAFLVKNGTGGVLAGQTLLPDDAKLTLIGGPGHRYWVDGANRDGGASGLEGDPAEAGTWRIEVAPASAPDPDAQASTLLLHALTIGVDGTTEGHVEALPMEADEAAPAPAILLRGLGDMPAKYVVISGAVPRMPIRFARVRAADSPVGVSWITLTDIVPGATYRIAENLAPDNMSRQELVASDEGVLEAHISGVRMLAFGVCPYPEGAGEDWQRLCDAEGVPTQAATATSEVTPGASPTASVSRTPTGPTPEFRCFLPMLEAGR